jgi:hypothetical protein
MRVQGNVIVSSDVVGVRLRAPALALWLNYHQFCNLLQSIAIQLVFDVFMRHQTEAR